MPIEIAYLHGGYGIEIIGKGVVSGKEIYDGNRIIYSGDTLSRHKYQIVNFANVERLEVSQEEAVKLANQDIEASKTNPNIVIAVVASRKAQRPGFTPGHHGRPPDLRADP